MAPFPPFGRRGLRQKGFTFLPSGAETYGFRPPGAGHGSSPYRGLYRLYPPHSEDWLGVTYSTAGRGAGFCPALVRAKKPTPMNPLTGSRGRAFGGFMLKGSPAVRRVLVWGLGVFPSCPPVVAIRPFGPFADRNGFMRRRWRRGVIGGYINSRGYTMYTPQFSSRATVTVRRLAWDLKVSCPKPWTG
jgi:hypothetical protein